MTWSHSFLVFVDKFMHDDIYHAGTPIATVVSLTSIQYTSVFDKVWFDGSIVGCPELSLRRK